MARARSAIVAVGFRSHGLIKHRSSHLHTGLRDFNQGFPIKSLACGRREIVMTLGLSIL